MAKITQKQVRQDLLDQLDRNGRYTAYEIDLINDYMALWEIAKKLAQDIKERGVNCEIPLADGRTKRVKNESVGELLKTNAQMLKLLDGLNLRTIAASEEDDEL